MIERLRPPDGRGTLCLVDGVCVGVAVVSGIVSGVLWRLADERIAAARAGYRPDYIELHERLLSLRNATGLLAILAAVGALLPKR